MNNKKLPRKTTSSIVLAMVLIAGTITALYPSFIIGVQAQGDPYHQMYNKYNSYEQQPTEYPPQYQEREYNNYKPSYEKDSYDTPPSYGNDNYQPREYSSYQQDYKQEYPKYVKDNYKPKKDSVSINKVNCINNNVNINGNNTGDINLGNKGQGYSGGYSSTGSDSGYDGGEGYGKQGKGFDCIINNNNTNNNVAGSGNQTSPPKATLNVSKIVTCTYLIGGLTPQDACGLIEENITENQFLIEVTDDNPTPSQFPGSESGTIVTLGAGNYVISETFDATSLQAEIESIEDELKRLAGGGGVRDYNVTGPIVSFTGDCNAVNGGFEATGTIGAGESKTCEIENHFDIGLADEICTNGVDDDGDGLADTADPDCTTQGGLTASNINPYTSAFDINSVDGLTPYFSSPPTIAQETEDDLSATEKITKLKQQWLELLP